METAPVLFIYNPRTKETPLCQNNGKESHPDLRAPHELCIRSPPGLEVCLLNSKRENQETARQTVGNLDMLVWERGTCSDRNVGDG